MSADPERPGGWVIVYAAQRYRAPDGTLRWVLWLARADPEGVMTRETAIPYSGTSPHVHRDLVELDVPMDGPRVDFSPPILCYFGSRRGLDLIQ